MASQIGLQGKAEEAVSAAARALLEEWARDPLAARLMLVDAYTAGPEAAGQARRAMRTIETAMGTSFAATTGAAEISSLLVAGIVAGLAGVAGARLCKGDGGQIGFLSKELPRWAASYCGPFAGGLEAFSRHGATGHDRKNLSPSTSSSKLRKGGGLADKDATLLLSAVTKLAVTEGYEDLSLRSLLATAGVPRRAFYANFSSIEDCLATAIEEQTETVLACAREAAGKTTAPVVAACQAVVALHARVVENPALSGICFGGTSVAGALGVNCNRQLMAGLSDLVWQCITGEEGNDLFIEASVAAFWGLMERQVRTERLGRDPRLPSALAYLLLTPSIGASEVLEGLREV